MADSVDDPAHGERRIRQDAGAPRRSKIQHYIHDHPWVSPLVALALSVIVFAILAPTFRTPHNLSLVLQQASVLAAVSAGQALVVLSGGIDLSVGVVMVLSTLVIGTTRRRRSCARAAGPACRSRDRRGGRLRQRLLRRLSENEPVHCHFGHAQYLRSHGRAGLGRHVDRC